jgi:hypothetical protein
MHFVSGCYGLLTNFRAGHICAKRINVGGGFTTPTGRIATNLDYGGNFQAAGGLNLNQYLGVLGTFSFDGVGLTDAL